MVYESTGAEALRKENVDAVIKGIALGKTVLSQIMTIERSSSWMESYYRESSVDLVGVTNIPRLADFPESSPIFEKQSAWMSKAGLQSTVAWEDAISNNIPVIARTQFRIGHNIAQMRDAAIWSAIRSAVNNSVAITAGLEWDTATRADRHPQDAILAAAEAIEQDNYTADTLVVNPYEKRYLLGNDDIMDAFSPSDNVMKNGLIGRIEGLNILVSTVVPQDSALVVASRAIGTYRILEDMKTVVKVEEGIKHTIRGWEIGVAFCTDPNAGCIITNTK